MKKLPLGYFAVKSDFENSPKDRFTFRGETFSVTEGENLFGNISDALAACKDSAAPQEIICSLPYEKFEAPVLIFSSGNHEINVFDRIKIEHSVVMLGEKAGINPNVPSDDRLSAPTLNPEREENESILCGSYWFGKLHITAAACEHFIMDGFICAGVRFTDMRTSGGKFHFESKNIIHKGRCGWEHNHYNFKVATIDGGLDRDILIKNVRITEFPDLDYGGNFVLLNARKAVLDNICFTKTGQIFGFTTIPRGFQNYSQFPETEITLKNSYIADATGENGICTGCFGIDDKKLQLNITGCTFVNASEENTPVINPHVANDNCSVNINDCVISDTRGNTACAISLLGEGENVKVENCKISGFAGDVTRQILPTGEIPQFIDTSADVTDCEDPHKIVKNADFSPLDEHYADRKVYYGDQHVHTRCGGTSDGSYPMTDWPAEMDRLGVDFAAVVDHRQMRGFFLPEWDKERFIIGTEPSARLLGLNAVNEGYDNIHYNMLFPHKYGLAMVLANFPEYGFKGDELTGSFGYPAFTKARFMELTQFVQSIGGMMVHPHPKTMLSSRDPLDYYVGEHMFLETLYCTFDDHVSFKNYKLWTELLALGKHVYTSGGSDTHRAPTNALVSTFYTKEKSGKAFFDQMRTGDFTVGCVGMKMFIDGNPMGSELEYKDGMVLTLRIDDFFKSQWKENTAYELRIHSDEGLVYKSAYDGVAPQEIALECKKRKFYRAEVFDLTHGYYVAVSNPIWLDK